MGKHQGLVVALVISVMVFVLQMVARPQFDKATKNSLRLHLSVDKQSFVVGETINLRVELWNEGTHPVFVGSEIPVNFTWIYYLMASIEDSNGKSSPGMWGELDPQPPDPKESFASALAKAWIALPPGYSYATRVEIDSDMFEFLKKPGRYRLRAKYVSLGMDVPLYYNALIKKPEEMAKLPFASWKGEIEGNSLWIEITAPDTDKPAD